MPFQRFFYKGIGKNAETAFFMKQYEKMPFRHFFHKESEKKC
jgi:hypothetical protein